MKELLSTKEVSKLLGINEKMVYALISEKGLPATKITGKWLFPKHLIEQWVENSTLNYPKSSDALPAYQGLLILTGSNDILPDKTISLFNNVYPVPAFGLSTARWEPERDSSLIGSLQKQVLRVKKYKAISLKSESTRMSVSKF